MRILRLKLRRDMRRQRGQFLAIGLTIFLGVALFGASYDAYRNLDASYQQAFTEFRFANLTVTGGDTEKIAGEARAADGVAAVEARTQADLPFQVGNTKLLGRLPSNDASTVGPFRIRISDTKAVATEASQPIAVTAYWISDFPVWSTPVKTLFDSQVEHAQFQPQLLPSSQLGPQVGGPSATAATSGISLVSTFGTLGRNASFLDPKRQLLVLGGRSTSVVGQAESNTRLSSDAGSLLRLSPSGLGVSAPVRNPIVTDTRVRGSRVGSQGASGSHWVPARIDLHTTMSKIDSRSLDDIIVIKGPYSSRYGPGFDFIDFQLLPSPRFEWAQPAFC